MMMKTKELEELSGLKIEKGWTMVAVGQRLFGRGEVGDWFEYRPYEDATRAAVDGRLERVEV
jgi:hypothetical protein